MVVVQVVSAVTTFAPECAHEKRRGKNRNVLLLFTTEIDCDYGFRFTCSLLALIGSSPGKERRATTTTTKSLLQGPPPTPLLKAN